MCLNPKDNSKGRRFSGFKVTVDSNTLPTLTSCKLLGVIINNRAEWSNHIQHVYERANRKMFIIRKLKGIGLPTCVPVNVYSSHIRSILEYCCLLWGFNLSQKMSEQLNSIERRALFTILGHNVSRTKHVGVCEKLGILPLEKRRDVILQRFEAKLLSSDRFKFWLEPYVIKRQEGFRYNKNRNNFRLVACKHERYKRSTIPMLVNFLRNKCE